MMGESLVLRGTFNGADVSDGYWVRSENLELAPRVLFFLSVGIERGVVCSLIGRMISYAWDVNFS
jgi:hypothetical protein